MAYHQTIAILLLGVGGQYITFYYSIINMSQEAHICTFFCLYVFCLYDESAFAIALLLN